jgi:hypothetical protein
VQLASIFRDIGVRDSTQGNQDVLGWGFNLSGGMWQLRERLSVGIEELYGYHETKDGKDGDAFRTSVALMYSIF